MHPEKLGPPGRSEGLNQRRKALVNQGVNCG